MDGAVKAYPKSSVEGQSPSMSELTAPAKGQNIPTPFYMLVDEAR